MKKPMETLLDLRRATYDGDPKVGDVVLLRHNFVNVNVAGEITGLKRKHPHRGYDPDGDYEVIVYQEFDLKMAGLKGWFRIGEEAEWEIVAELDDDEYHKLGANVVLQSKVDDLLNDTDEDDDEL